MRRRTTPGRKLAKTQQRKLTRPKRADAANAVRQANLSVSDLQEQLKRRTRELEDAREQQASTAEVLKVISGFSFDLQSVFDMLVRSALKLCEAERAFIFRFDGQVLRAVASQNVSPEVMEFVQRNPVTPGQHSASARAAHERRTIHIEDIRAEPGYTYGVMQIDPIRTVLAIPLLKAHELLGVIVVYRYEVRQFTARQIALLETFADQAVIAIENLRLFEEMQARTRELAESLQYQTATSDVLSTVARSPSEPQRVLDLIIETAMRLCQAESGNIWKIDGCEAHAIAAHGFKAEFVTYQRSHPIRPGRSNLVGRIMLERRIMQIEDVLADPEYSDAERQKVGRFRTVLGVPMLRNDELIGVIALAQSSVRPFSDRQIALVTTFADQALIAIGNTRLFEEVRARTRELTESLEQQTATAEILQVINSSPGDLAPVFDAMLEKALRLCDAAFGVLWTYDGENFRASALHGVPPAFAEVATRDPRPAGLGTSRATLLRGVDVVHIADAAATEAYLSGEPMRRAVVELGGARTLLGVPLRKDNILLGAFVIYRREVRPFSDKQIALLQNFAAQAVIAMENARLLGELRQRTEEVVALNRGLEARVAEQVEELGRVGRLKRFLAPQLAELIVSQGDEKILESHRREIVVVFCDLRGYTAFSETAEPEEVLDFLREYHGALGPLVSQFEGTLDQFSGDGIMVFFNDPVPIPDPAGRAVAMAVAMREAAGALNVAWRERGRVLGFGVGIAQGYATLGQIGFSERFGYTAIGTVCNVAARLCAEAKDGQILLSQRVNVALKGSLATEQVGALALKGLTQPVVAYNVLLSDTQPALRVIQGGPEHI